MREMSIPESAWWHAVNLALPGTLPKTLRIAEFLGGPQALLEANESQLLSAGLHPTTCKHIISGKKTLDPAEEWDKLSKSGIKSLNIHDGEYPRRLKEIYDPPPLLYIRGRAEVLAQEGLAVVGSRKITPYGQQAVREFVPEICNAGKSVISGLAFGVDAAALNSCLDNDGVPVAVLGSSLAYHEISPQFNLGLARTIEKAGCLLSEVPPGRPSYKINFPMRNRIISGLSLGVLVIEADLHSGSLITANHAVAQNREVLAVPGSIFSQMSAGTMDLIKKGAKCVTSFEDISEEYGWDKKQMSLLKITDPLEVKIVALLKQKRQDLESLIRQIQAPSAEILSALTSLEIAGCLQRSSEGVYAYGK